MKYVLLLKDDLFYIFEVDKCVGFFYDLLEFWIKLLYSLMFNRWFMNGIVILLYVLVN